MALRMAQGGRAPLTTTNEPSSSSSYTGEKGRRSKGSAMGGGVVLNADIFNQIINQLRDKGVTLKLVMQFHGIIAIFMGVCTLILPHR